MLIFQGVCTFTKRLCVSFEPPLQQKVLFEEVLNVMAQAMPQAPWVERDLFGASRGTYPKTASVVPVVFSAKQLTLEAEP